MVRGLRMWNKGPWTLIFNLDNEQFVLVYDGFFTYWITVYSATEGRFGCDIDLPKYVKDATRANIKKHFMLEV
jgi:hypothetical protein